VVVDSRCAQFWHANIICGQLQRLDGCGRCWQPMWDTGVTGSFRTWAADEGGKCGGTCHKLWWQASAGGGSGGNMANREVLR
jgi:hypothetical protein